MHQLSKDTLSFMSILEQQNYSEKWQLKWIKTNRRDVYCVSLHYYLDTEDPKAAHAASLFLFKR